MSVVLASIPPLENGARLSRDEFEIRYEAMPNLKRAELIEGVVYLPDRGQFRYGQSRARLTGWLGVYQAHTPGTAGAVRASLRLDGDNEVQPDTMLFRDPGDGRPLRVDPDEILAGAPELIGEVATSNASYDLHPKLQAYRRNGVAEYIVWRLWDKAIDWFSLRGCQYDRMLEETPGVIQSKVFPGLWLDVAALIAGDMVKVHEVLHQGLASSEHAAFVAKLRKAGPPV